MSHANEICPAELPNWCAQRHWSIFWILILCSLAMVAGRVLTLGDQLPANAKPFFSANDRSRWATVRALGDHGTFELDQVLASDDGRQWDSIDKVRHIGTDGQLHSYSSKPPLLPVLVTGQYQMLKWLTGWEIATDTFGVVRILLMLINVIPWGLYLWFVARMVNSVPVRDWTRYYVLACAGFGTFLGPFVVTLNNHLPAAISVMIALYCVSEMIRKASVSWHCYFAAGFFSAFAVTNELPALSFFAAAGLIGLTRSFSKTMMGFLPAAALVGAAAVGTNWWAHGQLNPAYAQRHDGTRIAIVAGEFSATLDQGKLPDEIRQQISATLKFQRPTVEIGCWPSTPSSLRRWVVRDTITASQFAIVSADNRNYELLNWENWYDYPGSYWLSSNDRKKSAVDLGQASIPLYTFHVLFGHHGIFSLTPIWLFSLAGMLALLGGAKMGGTYQMRWLGAISLAVSVVVIAFYLTRPTIDRNYGGFACSLRWLLWLAPLWLMSMLPVVDWLAGSRGGKFLCFTLLFLSALSAMYPANNPWVHPWLYEIWDLTGLPR